MYDGHGGVRIDRYLGEKLMGLCILVGSSLVLWSVAVGEEGVEGVSLRPCFVAHGGSLLEGIRGLRVSGRLAVRLVIQLYVGCISPFIFSPSKKKLN